MEQTNNLISDPMDKALLGKRMLMGAGPALILIVVFLLQVRQPNPDWGKLWMVKPLIMVPLAGAMGGVFYYLISRLGYRSGWKMIAASILSFIIYLVGLWLGIVLGLNGTLWN